MDWNIPLISIVLATISVALLYPRACSTCHTDVHGLEFAIVGNAKLKGLAARGEVEQMEFLRRNWQPGIVMYKH